MSSRAAPADSAFFATLPKAELQDRVHEVLKLVGMDHAARQSPPSISGGMKLRAGLGRVLEPRHELEPTERGGVALRADGSVVQIRRAESEADLFATLAVDGVEHLVRSVIDVGALHETHLAGVPHDLAREHAELRPRGRTHLDQKLAVVGQLVVRRVHQRV